MALAKLHNFCIDETVIPIRQQFHEDVLESDQFDVIINEVFLDEDEQHILTCYNKFGLCWKRKDLVDLTIPN
jgi:hypothetical protein